ncbi:MAG: response regulator, partial [Pseudomonadota bacterium]
PQTVHDVAGRLLRPFGFSVVTLLVTASLAIADKARAKQVEAARRLDAQQAKARFLRTVSHDMRTPLNAILGFSDLLMEERNEDQRQEYYVRLKDAGAHLLNLVNNLLDWSRIDAGRLELNPAPACLPQEIEGCIRMVERRATEKGLSLTYLPDMDENLWHNIDAFRLRQVVINLIENAIKYTDDGGVTVELKGRRNAKGAGKDHFVINIKDTGIGLPDNFEQNLFEEYQQAYRVEGQQARGGVGLGLSISRQIAKEMNGNLKARSRKEGGSVFTVELVLERVKAPKEAKPVHVDKPEAKTTPPSFSDVPTQSPTNTSSINPSTPSSGTSARPSPEGPKILIVDDNTPNRLVVHAFLSAAGCSTLQAENGKIAVDMCEAHDDIQAILMDIDMPVMNGIEATKILRGKSGKYTQFPIIALTAHVLPEDRAELLEAGLTDILHKPVDREKLISLVFSHTEEDAQLRNEKGPEENSMDASPPEEPLQVSMS